MPTIATALSALTLVLSASVGLPSGTSVVGADAEASPILVTGDAPLGTKVQVLLRPSGAQLAALPIGEAFESIALDTTLAANGDFVSHLDPAEVPTGYLDPQGVANLSVLALAPDGSVWAEALSAQAVEVKGQPAWVDTLTPKQEPLAQGRFAILSDHAPSARGVSVGRLIRIGVNATESNGRAQAAGCYSRVLQRNNTLARAGNSYPVGRSKSWMKVNSSAGGRYGVAIKVPNHPVSRAGTQHAAGGWGVTWAASRKTRKYMIGVQYATIDNQYRDTNGNCQYYISYEPTIETGGATSQSTSRPGWGGVCVTAPRGATWSRQRSDGSPYSASLGVSLSHIAGINVSVSKQYTPQSQVISYAIKGNKMMCGKGAPPAVAADQYERFR